MSWKADTIKRAQAGWLRWALVNDDGDLVCTGRTRKEMRDIREPRRGEHIVIVRVTWEGAE